MSRSSGQFQVVGAADLFSLSTRSAVYASATLTGVCSSVRIRSAERKFRGSAKTKVARETQAEAQLAAAAPRPNLLRPCGHQCGNPFLEPSDGAEHPLNGCAPSSTTRRHHSSPPERTAPMYVRLSYKIVGALLRGLQASANKAVEELVAENAFGRRRRRKRHSLSVGLTLRP